MNNSVHMGEMTWKEYSDKVNGGAIIFIPIGAIEQHGYHMGLNVDVLLPTAVAEEVAKKVGGIVAPPICYGYKSQQKSGGGNFYPGTTSVDGSTLIATIRDIMREMLRHGVRKFVMVVGHFENYMFVVEAVDLFLREAKIHTKDRIRAMVLSYWDFCDDPEVLKILYPDEAESWALEHGGIFETSMMMYLHPHLVKLNQAETHSSPQFPHYDMFPPHKNWTPTPGTLSLPLKSSSEKGKLILDTCAKGITQAVQKEFL